MASARPSTQYVVTYVASVPNQPDQFVVAMRQEKQDCLQRWRNDNDEWLRPTREIQLKENERVKSLGVLDNKFTEVVALIAINDGKQETATQVKRWDLDIFDMDDVRLMTFPPCYNLWVKRDSFVVGLSNQLLTAAWAVNEPVTQRAIQVSLMSFKMPSSVIHAVEVSADGNLYIIPHQPDLHANNNSAIVVSNDHKVSLASCGSGQCQAFFVRPDDRYVLLYNMYAFKGVERKEKELYNIVNATQMKGLMAAAKGIVKLDSKDIVDQATLIDDRAAPATTTPLLCWSSQSKDRPAVHYIKFYDDEKNHNPSKLTCMIQLTDSSAIAQVVSIQGMISIFLVNGTVYLAQHNDFERGVKAFVEQEKKACVSMDLLVKQGFFSKKQLAVADLPEVRAAQAGPVVCALQ